MPLPSNLALTVIADGALAVAADVRNDFSSIQNETNALLGILGGGVTGQFLKGVGTTVSFDYPPGYEYAYTEYTSNVSVTATTAATANTVVTAAAVTFDGATLALLQFFAPRVDTPAGGVVRFELYEDGAAIGQLGAIIAGGASSFTAPAKLERRRTPVAGARTYSMRAWVDAGTGTVGGGVGGSGVLMPGFIRITKV